MPSLKKIERIEASVPAVGAAEKRNLVHKRLDRWIRLQQFVYGLPDDYSYALVVSHPSGGARARSRSLVRVGWMSWFGEGSAVDRHQALAVSLLNASEALSSSASAVYLHQAFRLVKQVRNFLGARRDQSSPSRSGDGDSALLAG